jgi:hypothetical protein
VLVAWVLFPIVLVALCAGCGLLVERVAGLRIHGALVVPAGFALLVVVGALLTVADATAELATPIAVVLALAGFALSARRVPELRPDPWAAGCALLAFLAFGAPVLLSGEATFAGYIKLDDTATWMAFTDRTMEHGRSLDGLPPSSYEATLDLNLTKGYPTGVFVPYGIGQALVGEDLAWLFQPYEALLAAFLALCLFALAGPQVASPRLRALIALVAAQSALLLGYALWGGVKEVAGAMLLALLAALALLPLRGRPRGVRALRGAIPVAFAAAALLGTLSAGAAIWLLPLLAPVAVAAIRKLGGRATLGRAAWVAALTAALTVPVIAIGGLLPLDAGPLTNERSLGNLLEPLSPLQAFGIWPSGDFRLDPDAAPLAYALIGLAAVLGVVGLAFAWRVRAGAAALYVAGAIAGSALIVGFGSPWTDAKALAIASPALLLAALLGAAGLLGSRLRPLGVVGLAAIALGVLWSNALAYREVNLAPRAQLAELELIGDRIAGQGPTLMTEYQPYGVRHFLREADPEGASELRRRPVPLRGGEESKKGAWADTDELATDGLLVYRTLVLRRSPAQSRPPSPYELTWRGAYYEVWQRSDAGAEVVSRLPLGRRIRPAGTARCADVERLARLAAPGGRLAAASPLRPIVLRLTDTVHPRAWEDARYGPSSLLPRGQGEIRARLSAPVAGRYEAWLGGSVRGEIELRVDGELAGESRHRLNNPGQYVNLGEVPLGREGHVITLHYEGPDLHPGSGGQPLPFGPLVFSRTEAADARISYVPPSQAAELCGRRWDWIEAVA